MSLARDPLLGDRLVELCDGAKDVFLAAPYIKALALRKILRGINSHASLAVVTKWTPNDLAMGSSDLECRSVVTDLGGSFRLHPSIHAKYFRAGTVSLVGSANISGAALGWSTQPNVEILCTPGSDFDGARFESLLLEQSRGVSDEEFAYWEEIDDIHTGYRDSEVVVNSPTLEDWWPRTREFRNLERAYRGKTEDIASTDEQRAAGADIAALRVPPGLQESEFRAWVATALLAAPFTQTVIRVLDVDPAEGARRVAIEWNANLIEARRGCEAVQSWLASVVPQTFRTDEPAAGLPGSE